MRRGEIGILAAVLISVLCAPGAAQQQDDWTDRTKPTETEVRVGSGASDDVDWKNKIVAIRRLTLMVDDIDSNMDRIKRGIPYVEIELQTESVPRVGALMLVFRIGPWDFYSGGRGCGINPRCQMINMTPEEYDALEDGDLISMRYGVGVERKSLVRPPTDEMPAPFVTRFGKLDKTLIDRCAPVERNATDH